MNYYPASRFFAILLGSLCLALPGRGQDAEDVFLASPVPDSDLRYLVMEGALAGSLDIRMFLTVTDGSISGVYYYRKNRQLIALYGSREGVVATLTESSWAHTGFQDLPYEGNTGTFQGDLKLPQLREAGDPQPEVDTPYPPATFTGTWTSPNGKKSLPFHLVETYDSGAVRADLYSFSASWERKRLHRSITRERSFQFPQFSGDAPGLERINAILREHAAGYPQLQEQDRTASPEEIFHKIDPARVPSLADVEASITVDPAPRAEWDFSLINVESYDDEIQIVHNEGGFLSIRFYYDSYTGGAHGNQADSHTTFDIRTGEVVPITAVLKAGYEKPLSEVATQVARKNWGLKEDQLLGDGPIFDDTLELNRNWFLTPDGIGFSYFPYEIGPYVAGFINFSLPREAISEWTAPGSALEKAVRR